MTSKLLGLRTAAYLVNDLDAAKDWYSKALGVKPYFDEEYYVGFNIGGFELGLMPDTKTPESKIGGVYAYWGVKDIQEAFSHLLDLGGTSHEPPQNVGGELMVASVKDPWGNILGIIYNPDFQYSENK